MNQAMEAVSGAVQVHPVLDRLHGAFSSVVEFAGNVGENLPKPSGKLATMLGLGSLAAFSAEAVLPSVADAKIDTVHGGIAGVTLGQTEAQVTSHLGTPTAEQPVDAQGITTWNYAGAPLKGAVSFSSAGTVEGIVTYSTQQKTAKGVGPGVKLAKVKKSLPHVKCSPGPFGPKSVICISKIRQGGHVVETTVPFFSRTTPAREVDINLG